MGIDGSEIRFETDKKTRTLWLSQRVTLVMFNK